MFPAYLGELNEEQRRAVLHAGGPLQVVAGAGTGKTRTLVHRVAHLVALGAEPERILLLTFTRRAAAEMVQRAATTVPGAGIERAWGGTFHGVANRLLRLAGRPPRHRSVLHGAGPGRRDRAAVAAADRDRSRRAGPPLPHRGDAHGGLQQGRQHPGAAVLGARRAVPVVRRPPRRHPRSVRRLRGAQAPPPRPRLRRPAALVAGRPPGSFGRAGPAGALRPRPRRRVPGHERGPGGHRRGS